MATGIVSIKLNPPYQGFVTMDETGDLYWFTQTNLKDGEAVTFDIQEDPKSPSGYDAINIQPAPTQQIITIPAGAKIQQNVTANSTDNIKIVQADTNNPGVLVGNVTINGGMVYIDNAAQISGNLSIQAGGVCVIKKKGTVTDGGHTIQSGGNLKVVNGGGISGDINGDSAGAIIIGNANGGGSVKGNINIKKIHRLSITNTSSINCG